jgi:two-component sensor histidine kinase
VHLRQLYINEALPDYRNPSDSNIQKIKFDSVQAFENYPINPKIPSGQNHLGFQFSAIDWSAATKINYSFRLLGLDNKWSAPSAKTMAEYRNLPHGKFVFQICAIGIGGKWSQPFEYTFTINPPWWHTWWFRSLMLAAFVSAIFAYIKYRTRSLLKRQQFLQSTVEKRTEELRIALTDKEALLKEIHHRVKNNLEVISSLLMLQTKTVTDEKAKAGLMEGQSRVQSIALIHHKLYRTDDLGSVELIGFSKDLFKQIKDVFNQPGTKVDFYINETEIWLNTDAAVPFGLIFNELITNAFKYGVAATSENLFTMHATSKQEENNTHYHFVFRDNGPGLPDDFSLEKTSSLGMKVIRLLTKQLDGTSKFYSDNGTVFELQFSKRNLPS